MYEFRPVDDRIAFIRQKVRDRCIRFDSEKRRLVTEFYQDPANAHIVPIIKRPLSTKYVCENCTLRIEDYDFFVGNKTRFEFGSCFHPTFDGGGWVAGTDFEGTWHFDEEEGLYHSPDSELLVMSIAPEDIQVFKDTFDFWQENMVGATASAWQPNFYDELCETGVSTYFKDGPMGPMTIPVGHLAPGFQKIVDKGYGPIKEQAQAWIDSHYGNLMGEDLNKYLFYESAVIICDAAITLVSRYSQLAAEKAAACTDQVRKAELERMAEGLAWISEHGARNLWEAMQAFLLYQVLLGLDCTYPGIAFGRFDQIMWPYLERELEEGTITLDEAQILVDAFFLKANTFYDCAPGYMTTIAGIGNTYQHTTIAGCDPETGECAVNPVTYMVLQTVGRLGLHDPTISLRVTKDMPDDLWECALETSKLVGGLPLFQNDDIIIPSLQEELGFSLYDARNYSVIACQEIVGTGCDYPAPNGVHPPHASLLWSVIFDMAINDGENPLTHGRASIHTGYLYEMNSIEEVRNAMVKLSRHIMKMFVSMNNFCEYFDPYLAPHAALSITIDGCMESGKDCAAGGAKYNSFGGTATGLATVADSLTTIKYMCFDKKLCTTRELYDAVMANWEGYEDLRQQILAQVPHYGNNDPYADVEMKFICDLYYDLCSECYSVRSKKYKAGLYGASDHVAQGYRTWATPDGRRFGEPIADATSPAQSRDKEGPTAVFESTCCFDHHHYMDGMALNLRMHPSVLSNEAGIAKLRDVTKAYFNEGGMEVQYNVVSSDTLRAAQEDPEGYRDLVVRIAGYSAYFVELSGDQQNDIIARHENQI